MFERNMMHRLPTKIEFNDLSICTQKYFRERYPKHDFGKEKTMQYGTFVCGGNKPDGTRCQLKYGLKFQADACRKWHKEELNNLAVQTMLNQQFLTDEDLADDADDEEDVAFKISVEACLDEKDQEVLKKD